MSRSTRRTLLLAGLAACLPYPAVLSAQEAYPSKQITIIVPSSPGGATDIGARLIAKELQASWKQPVIVENKPGASTMIANGMVARAPKDGYTLLLTATSLIQLPAMQSKIPYEVSDLAPVSQTAVSYSILAVPGDFPANNIKELLAKVKSSPDKLTWGSSGPGTTSHIYGEYFNRQSGAEMIHVPYKSASALLADMLGGHVKVGILDVGVTIPHIRSGKMKALAIIGTKRAATLPNVPTFLESGFKGFEQLAWMGVFAPAGTPKDRIEKLSTEISRITKLPAVSKTLADVNLEPVGSTAEEYSAVVKKDMATWKMIIDRGAIKLE
jgi:tripartite-type tricarboxylate transporter receptor subunit TctC